MSLDLVLTPSSPRATNAPPCPDDIVCFCHLRWNFVFQRPQHLLTRFARDRRVFVVEEPLFDSDVPRLDTTRDGSGVFVVVPHLAPGISEDDAVRELRALVDGLFVLHDIDRCVLWYYTAMALRFTSHLEAAAIVYDCMDELSAFAQAPAGLRQAEKELMRRADVMLTGGHSLFDAKRDLHRNVHAVPSSVDAAHFGRARHTTSDPDDQSRIPHPRLGFFGVIDERFDIPLLSQTAALRPEWQFVLLGPVVKIDPAALPKAANIHYLGAKSYAQLPGYIAGWDVAWLPFARNEATRFISPTKTPEYLAAGKPVVSTSIRDVVRPYGDLGLARIADTPDAVVAAVEQALAEPPGPRTAAADAFLARTSWDATWAFVASLLQAAVSGRRGSIRLGVSAQVPGVTTRSGKDQGSCSITSS